jgi:aldose 1-epimerase
MTVATTEPGVQCYTFNWGSKDAAAAPHIQHNGICFEAQHYPDSINQPQFPTTVLRPGETYTQTTVHAFSN